MQLTKSLMIGAVCITVAGLAGCSGKSASHAGQNAGGGTAGMTGMEAGAASPLPYGTGSGSQTNAGSTASGQTSNGLTYTRHTNKTMTVSPEVAKQLLSLNEVQAAKAVITEANVYVAVALKDGIQAPKGGGMSAPGASGEMSSIGAGGGGTATDGPLNDVSRDSPRGTRDPHLTSGITGNSYDYYAGRTAALDDGMPADLKQRMIDKVRSVVGPNIQHIYVSDDQQLMQKLASFEQSASDPHVNANRVTELNALANRLFPTTANTGSYGGSTSGGQTANSRGNSYGPAINRGTPSQEK